MSFNLLQLPYLARKEIFNLMTLPDLFDFAQCSKKAKRLLKSEYKANGYTMFLSITDTICFVAEDHAHFNVSSEKKLSTGNVAQRRKIGKFDSVISHRNLCEEENPGIETYWSDILMGAEQMLKELNDLFAIKIYLAQVDFNEIEVEYQPLIRWLNSYEPRFESQIFNGSDMDFGQYMWILENVESAIDVEMEVEPKEYFRKETLKIEIENVLIAHARWVTVKHLISMQCTNIHIYGTSLTDEDLNQFLKSLVAGSNVDLEHLAIKFGRENDMNVVLDGLQAEIGDGDYDPWRVRMENGWVCLINRITFDTDDTGIRVIVDKN